MDLSDGKTCEMCGYEMTEQEAREIIGICERKIELNGLGSDYMRYLLPDEIKDYFFRKAVNTVSAVLMYEGGADNWMAAQ